MKRPTAPGASRPPLSQNPIRRGAVYCSPACGHGCLYADYIAASESAIRLAAACGPGWIPRISENLGWYFRVEKNGAAMHQHNARAYWLTLSVAGVQYQYTATTPKNAITTLKRDMLIIAGAIRDAATAL